MSKSIAAVVALAGMLFAAEAKAQYVVGGRSTSPVAGYSSGYAGMVATAPATAGAVSPYRYYSYYAAYPRPARGYVGYGAQDNFAFRGQPYGHPYDPWTWPYLEGSYRGSLARYYDPPVK